MNSGPTSERVYAALKAKLLANAFAPGARLDPALLASDLASSVTPVRDALHLLTGERLVDTRVGDGFHVPHLTGPGLEDLYAWSAEVLLLSLRYRAVPADGSSAPVLGAGETVANRTAILFDRIAGRSVNREHALATRLLGDRLHAVRTVEPAVVGDTDDTLAAIEAVVAADDIAALRKTIAAYHRRRRRLAFDIVRLLYRHD